MELELDFDPAAVCRICLSSTNKLLNIFSSTVVDGYITAVPHMILHCLDIQVSTADGLPDKVCSVCKSDIVNFFTFKEKSKRSESVLKTTLRPKSPSTSSVSVVEAPKENANPAEEIKNEKSATVPPAVPINKEKAEAAPQPSPIKMEKTATTQPPVATSPPPPVLEEECVHQEELDSPEADTDDVDLIFNCEVCGESFETLDGLRDHCEVTHEEVHSIEHHSIKEEVIIDDDVNFGSVDEDNPEEHYEGEEEDDDEVVADHDESEAYADEEYTEIDQLDDYGVEMQTDFLCQCGKRLASNEELQMHVKMHHETRDNEMDVDSENDLDINQSDFSCLLCNIFFENRDHLIMHYNEVHEYFCEECVVVFTSKDTLLRHNTDAHKPQTAPSRIIPATTLPEFRCSHCDKSIRGQLKYDQHQKLHDSMNVINNYITFYPCHQCHLIFLTESEGMTHQSFHEENDDKPANDQFVDTSCTDYQFLDEDGYDDAEYTCGICNLVLSSAADAKFHLVTHSAVFTCPYDVCGCQYDNFGRYTSHIMNKHVNGQDHRCSHCGHQLNSFDELQAHLKLKCSERKFACDHCDKKFFSSKALRLHERVIKGKTFMCQFCGKSFAQQGELTIHNRTHTGERPFACTVCGKQYKTSSMRTAHMDTHIPGKTFSCSFCDKKLQTRTSYRNHMKRHTENKKHECTYCGKMFFTKYHVKLHTMKVHEKRKIADAPPTENVEEQIQITYVEQAI